MSRRRSRSASPGPGSGHHTTNSNDPRDLERRIFVGNLPTTLMERKDMEDLFSPYGKINALSMFRGYGFVQFERAEEAEAAKAGQNGRFYRGYKLDVNMAAERRQNKAHSRQSPPRRNPYGEHGNGREAPSRSRSPTHSRDSRDHRDDRDMPGRDMREPGRDMRERSREMREHSRETSREPRGLGHPHEPRGGGYPYEPRGRGHPREHDPRDPHFDRYRGPEGREKDPRGDPNFRDEGYDRYYRMDDYHRKKEEPYGDRYRDPWNGRRGPEEGRPSAEERRRNELYRQYYEELQRRYDSERPVDCSVIVVNKQQKEYAETVGRKVRDMGIVVDLIFLNTEVSLTQALEDVGRARTPFAIVITQQHEVHHSCTVNILFGTPQEHRNMPMQDAMVLVGHNYDKFKVENRDKERDEIARKAAKMADDVLMREHEREGHPIALQPAITLLSECRYLTLEELDGLIVYLRDKRERLARSSGVPHAASHNAAPAALAAPPPTQSLPSVPLSAHTATPAHTAHSAHTAHNAANLPSANAVASTPASPSSHQMELQAKILSLFNSGSGASSAPAQGYSNMGASSAPGQGYSTMGSSSIPAQGYSTMGSSSTPGQGYSNMGASSTPAQGYGSMGASSAPTQGYSQMGNQTASQTASLPSAHAPSSNMTKMPPQSPTQGHGMMGARPALRPPTMASSAPSQYGPPSNRMANPQASARPTTSAAGINFDNPSVLKALDTLIQSGPSINHLVNPGNAPAPRPVQGMSQPPPMSHYARHY